MRAGAGPKYGADRERYQHDDADAHPEDRAVGDRLDLAGAALLTDPGAGMARLFQQWHEGTSAGTRGVAA